MTPHELMCAVRDRKAIVWGPGIKTPAAFVANWQFHRVMNIISTMHIYQPIKPKTKKHTYE